MVAKRQAEAREQQARLNQRWIQFRTHRGSTDRRYGSRRLYPTSHYDWLWRIGAGADDIGTADSFLKRLDGHSSGVVPGQIFCVRQRSGTDSDLVKLADSSNRIQMRFALHTSAQDGEDLRVFAG